jgi:tetratricopeptide (TPR) repeat protein
MAPSAEVLKSKSSIKTLRSDLLESLRILAECESLAGRHQDAMRDAREAYRVADAQGNNTDIGETLLTLGELQQRAGELEAAYETYELRYQRSGQHGANYQRWHEDLRSMCTIRLKQGRRVEAMKLAEELWQKEKSSPEANADHSHLRDVARLALQCQEALIKESPNLPPSANLIEWKAVIAKAK